MCRKEKMQMYLFKTDPKKLIEEKFLLRRLVYL